jgi:hypothetical protein
MVLQKIVHRLHMYLNIKVHVSLPRTDNMYLSTETTNNVITAGIRTRDFFSGGICDAHSGAEFFVH